MKKKNEENGRPRMSLRIKAILSLLTIALILSGCEAKLDLNDVDHEKAKPVYRTDQLLAVTSNGTVNTVVGSFGLVLNSPKVSFGGKPLQWTRTVLPGEPSFIDIDTCPDNSMIALAAEHQLWLSSENGQEWVKKEIPTREDVLSMTCSPNGDYWVVGSFSTILRSVDKGENWTESSLDEDAILTQIQFIDAQHGIISGEFGMLAKTEDGGQNWRPSHNIPNEFYPEGSYFSDLQHGWVGGLKGTIFYTADGGESWEQQETPTEAPIYDFYAVNDRLFAFGSNTTALELVGQRWMLVDTPHLSTYLRDGLIIADNQLLIIGGKGLMLTIDIKRKQSTTEGPL